jgi:predicted MFS family arabinose efflux permease
MEDLTEAQLQTQKEQMAMITWKLFLTNKDVFFTLATCFIGIFNLTFFEGFLTPELVKYDVSEGTAGLIMSIMSVFYLLGCLLYPRLFENVPRKL